MEEAWRLAKTRRTNGYRKILPCGPPGLIPTRLRQIGPYYYSNPTSLNANVTGVDSSKVTVDVPGGITAVHSSYRSLPPVVLDLTQTMLGIPSTNRCPIAGTARGFTLEAAAVTTCGGP